MLHRLFIIGAILILCIQAHPVVSQQIIELSVEDGLSQGFVSSIAQDKNGYIWIGTLNGLNRYDGYQFKTYYHTSGDPGSVAPGEILWLETDNTGKMWVITTSSVQYYNPEKDCFETPEQSTSVKEKWRNLRALIEKDQLIISDGNSIRQYHRTDKDSKVKLELEFSLPVHSEDPGIGRLFCIYRHEDGKLWAGTQHGIIEIGSDRVIRRIFPEITSSVFEIWYDDLHHELCIQTGNRVLFIDKNKQKKIFSVPEVNYGYGLKGRKMGNQYVLFVGRHTLSWDGENLKPTGLDPDKKIVSGFVDRQQNIWIGFDGSGLMCIKKLDFKINRYIRKGVPASKKPVFDNDGSVWLDETQSGMYPVYTRYIPGEGDAVSNQKIRCFHLETGINNDYWLINENRELVRMDEAGRRFPVANPNPGKLKVYLGLNSLSDGRQFLVSASDNAFFFDPYNGDYIRIPELDTLLKIKHLPVSSIDVSGIAPEKGWAWIAGGDQLIGVRPDWGRKTYSLIRPDLRSLTEDTTEIRLIFAQSDRFDPNLVWIGTWNGLYRLDVEKKTAIRADSYHLPENEPVFCMAQAEPENIWVGTLHGLVNYECLSGESRKYTARDGLPAGEFNRNTVAVRKDGLIVMGTVNGYIAFYPSELVRNQKANRALITRVNRGNVSISVSLKDGEMFLPDMTYDSANLMIFFSALDFTSHDAQQYRFRVNKGSEWLYNGYKNNVSLVNLPDGKYHFEVQASLDGSTWSDSCMLHFNISPPWWRTRRAMLLIMLLIIIPSTVMVRNIRQLHREKHRNELLTQQSKFEQMLEESRERLLTNIAHDLKTPVTLINGLLDSWDENSMDKSRGIVDTIRRQGKDISRLVNQITDLNRISHSGTLPLNPVALDLYKLIPAIISSYKYLAGLKGIDLLSFIEPGLPLLVADENQVRAIIGNLLSNAVKFTPSGGSISYSVTADMENLYFTVSDSGPGVDPGEKEKIFERYYQSSHARETGGSGIGLSYASEMAGLLGGKLQLLDPEEGPLNGATFRLSLPLLTGSGSGTQSGSADFDTPPERDAPIVLVVEDHPEMGEYISQLLKSEYRIVLARDGRSGLENALRMIPDLIISDVMMPGMSGTELCEHLRADVRTSHIPIIMLTAKTDQDSVRTGLEKGANLYLTKPFDREQLRYYVHNSLRLANQLRNYYRASWSGGNTNPDLLPKGMPEAQEADFIKNVNEIIGAHFADNQFNVEKLAVLMHVSKAQLHRKIGALGGDSTGNMIRRYRIMKAGALLTEQPDLSVSDVAFACGFTDANYFSTAFSKEYGVSPTVFRRRSAN